MRFYNVTWKVGWSEYWSEYAKTKEDARKIIAEAKRDIRKKFPLPRPYKRRGGFVLAQLQIRQQALDSFKITPVEVPKGLSGKDLLFWGLRKAVASE